MTDTERRSIKRREMDKQYVRKDELTEIVQQAVAAGLRDYQCECVFGLDPEEVKQVGNALFAVKEIGDGGLAHGIEVMRDNHKFLARYTRFTGKIGTAVITLIIIGIVTIVGSTFVDGVRVWIKQIVVRG